MFIGMEERQADDLQGGKKGRLLICRVVRKACWCSTGLRGSQADSLLLFMQSATSPT